MEISSAIMESLQQVPGANIRMVREDPLSPDGETGLIVQIYGFDQDIKAGLAAGVAESISGLDGFENVFSSADQGRDRKRTRLNSSHVAYSDAVLCLKKHITDT